MALQWLVVKKGRRNRKITFLTWVVREGEKERRREMYPGKCVHWETTYGFLEVYGFEGDVFIHYEEIDLNWHFRKLHEGEEVLVETIKETPKGPVAKGVRLAGLEEYQEAKAKLERVLADAEQKLETKKWLNLPRPYLNESTVFSHKNVRSHEFVERRGDNVSCYLNNT